MHAVAYRYILLYYYCLQQSILNQVDFGHDNASHDLSLQSKLFFESTQAILVKQRLFEGLGLSHHRFQQPVWNQVVFRPLSSATTCYYNYQHNYVLTAHLESPRRFIFDIDGKSGLYNNSWSWFPKCDSPLVDSLCIHFWCPILLKQTSRGLSYRQNPET